MFGVTTWTLPARGVKALEWASTHGFTFVHLDPDDVQGRRGAVRFRTRADDLSLSLAGLAIKDLERTGLEDPQVGRSAIDRALEVASLLGIGYVYLPSFGAAQIVTLNDLEHTAELMSYALDETVGSALAVATENTLPGNIVRQLLGIVDNNRASLLFDTQNPVIAGLDCVALAEEVGHLVGKFVHVKDGRQALGDTPIGFGRCPLDKTLTALAKDGNHHQYVIESDYRRAGPCRPTQDQRSLEEILKRAWDARSEA